MKKKPTPDTLSSLSIKCVHIYLAERTIGPFSLFETFYKKLVQLVTFSNCSMEMKLENFY